ncbi:MAG: RNA polymerase sigma factor [Saprospiraceae bacterium]
MQRLDKIKIEDLKREDRETIQQFYKIVGGMIYARLLNLSVTKMDAEDIVQETISDTIFNIKTGRYKEQQNLKSYCFRIAMNKLNNNTRKSKNDVIKGALDLEHLNLSTDNLIQEIELKDYLTLFQKENPVCYDMLIKHYFEKEPLGAMALLYNKTINAMTAKMSKCRKKLREKFFRGRTQNG